jgi:cobalamin biosynthesis protein CobT
MSKFIPASGDMNAKVMTGAELMDATTTVVRTISRSVDTNIMFAGDGACTNGKEVTLPSIDSNADITRRQALVLGGFANHETLHNLMTDFEKLTRKAKRWEREGKHLTKGFANAIEDVRIEHGGTKLYGGMAKAIDQTSKEVTRKFIDEVYPQDPSIVEDFGKIGPVAITWEGRRRLGYPDPSNQEALDLLPAKIRKQVEKVVDATLGLDHGVDGLGQIDRDRAKAGSLDGARLAERIANKYMRDRKKEHEREQEQAQGDAQGQGDQGQGGGDNTDVGADGTGAQEVEGEGAGQQESGTYENGEGMDKGEESEQSGKGATGAESEFDPDAQPEPYDPNLDGAMDTVVAEINSSSSQNGRYLVMCPGGDITQTEKDVLAGRSTKRHYVQMYDQVRKSIGSELGTTRRKLERVMTATKDSYWENGKRSGRLDVRRNGTRIVQYGGNVFRRRQEETQVNAALSILIDLSGSMRGAKLDLAHRATIAIAEALDPVGVPLEIIGHNTHAHEKLHEVYTEKHTRTERYDRIHNMKTTIFKEFDQTLMQSRGMLGALGNMSGGGNADGDAILFAAKRLLDRREERKILFVLSDGAPAYASDTDMAFQRTRDCVEWCIGQGIEIVGLGMLSDDVRHFYPAYAVVQDMNQFAGKYVSEVGELLQGRGKMHADLMATEVRRGKRFA